MLFWQISTAPYALNPDPIPFIHASSACQPLDSTYLLSTNSLRDLIRIITTLLLQLRNLRNVLLLRLIRSQTLVNILLPCSVLGLAL